MRATHRPDDESQVAGLMATGFRARLGDCRSAARDLLGCVLVRRHPRGVMRALIVESEAYPHDDPASHSYGGRTARNASMFGRPGLAYVYSIHRCLCLNVVTGIEGSGEAVLIRAVEPIEGEELMAALRAKATVGASPPHGAAISNGPGKLCQALAIGRRFDGSDLLAGTELYLEGRRVRPKIAVSARVGISKSTQSPLRFFIADNPWVSRRP